MSVFSSPSYDGHERVVFGHDGESGLRAIIAIHNTALGPAVGGCRMWPYENEAAALEDALRLARGMTYKSALAGLPFGGGKAVIIGDSRTEKTPALMRAMGRLVDDLGGRYRVAEDVGTTVADMDIIAGETKYVTGTSKSGGNPSPYTAHGVFQGIRAAVEYKLRRNDGLDGIDVAIQGLGSVGYDLARRLHAAGARLHVADINAETRDPAFRCRKVPDLSGNRQSAGKCGLRLPVVHSARSTSFRRRVGAYPLRDGRCHQRRRYHRAGLQPRDLEREHDEQSIGKLIDGLYDTLMATIARAVAAKAPANEIANEMAEERFMAA